MPLTEHELRRHATPFSAPGEAGTLEQGFGAGEWRKRVRVCRDVAVKMIIGEAPSDCVKYSRFSLVVDVFVCEERLA